MKFYLQQGKLDSYWVNNYCHGNWKACIRYQKEEAGLYHPDNMMPNGTINNNLL